jgi:uncharacterized protein (TIGR03118 family)
MLKRLWPSLWSRAPHKPIRSSRYRPRVESIEDRLLLSTVIVQTNLVSDVPNLARVTDPNLVNPWGITPNPSGPFWISDNGTGLSTLYDGEGQINPLVVTIPPPAGAPGAAAPTGIVHNGSSDFVVQENGVSGASAFIFATEDGTISGWSPGVDLTNAILAVDNSASGAVYKGLALGTDSAGDNLLYAANFHDGTIDVFDKNFTPTQLSGSFTDPRIPQGYAPFNVKNLNGHLYVTYAKQNAEKHDDVAGIGHGFVDEYDMDGNLVRRLVTRGVLDSPWGETIAPQGFGKFSGDLLVGNFGNGLIHAYDPNTGAFEGTLRDANHRPIRIEGLWGLTPGTGMGAGDTDKVYFTAGINHEQDGLYGSLQAADLGSNRSGGDDAMAADAGRTAQANKAAALVVSQPSAGQSVTDTDPAAAGGMVGTVIGGASATRASVQGATLGQLADATAAAVDTLFALNSSSLGVSL